jgi:hypothetical protein
MPLTPACQNAGDRTWAKLLDLYGTFVHWLNNRAKGAQHFGKPNSLAENQSVLNFKTV